MKRAPVATVLMLVLASCATNAADVVTETAANLEELRSGVLELRVSTSTEAEEEGQGEAGFELIGSFQLPEEGELPVADLEYTDIGADDPATQGFISTGDQAFIEVDGQAYELPEEQTRTLRGGGGGDAGVFEGATVDEWFIDPELEEGATVDATEVDRVTGKLDVVTALNDLFKIAGRFGQTSGFQLIQGDEAERLENAVESSHIEVVSGTEDRVLRRLLIEVDLAIDQELELRDLLGPLAGVSFTIDMSISEPNEPVQVTPPTDPLPIEELTGA